MKGKHNFPDTLNAPSLQHEPLNSTERKKKLEYKITIFSWQGMRTTMKLKWKLFFLSRTKQHKKGKEKQQIVNHLQQQFASHWHKSGPVKGEENMENCYSLSSPFFANWIWIKHKQLEPMEWWFVFPSRPPLWSFVFVSSKEFTRLEKLWNSIFWEIFF